MTWGVVVKDDLAYVNDMLQRPLDHPDRAEALGAGHAVAEAGRQGSGAGWPGVAAAAPRRFWWWDAGRSRVGSGRISGRWRGRESGRLRPLAWGEGAA